MRILLLTLLLAVPATAREHPDVVLILADDLGWGDVGAYDPDSLIDTPHLDRLAREGTRLTAAHSPSAVCTPTRYGLLTGRYCWRTRLKRSVFLGFSPALIDPERLTLADLFREAGYATACIGKWHLGLDWHLKGGGRVPHDHFRDGSRIDFERPFDGGPLELGFDHLFGCAACPTTDPLYAFLRGDRTVGVPDVEWPGQGSEDPHELDVSWRPGIATEGWSHEQVDPTFVEEALRWLESTEEDRPRFLYLALSAPHAPWLPPEVTRGTTEEGARGDMVALADWAVGQVLTALEEEGRLDDTLVLFTSDNGPRIGLNGHASAGPWRGYKSHTWEGGHRVPFLVRWPGRAPAGAVRDELFSLTDVLASCAALLDEELPDDAGEDSLDLSALWLGEEPSAPREAVLSHSVHGHFSLQRGRWKLIVGTEGSGGWVPPRDDARFDPDEVQLYDLEEDPAETTDLADDEPEVVAGLRALLERYRAEGRSVPRR